VKACAEFSAMKSYLVTPIGGVRSLSLSLSWVDVPTTAHDFPHSGGLNSTLPTALIHLCRTGGGRLRSSDSHRILQGPRFCLRTSPPASGYKLRLCAFHPLLAFALLLMLLLLLLLLRLPTPTLGRTTHRGHRG
jgi:hypothetical protein